MADQPRLFDLPEPAEVKHPGQLSLHDWLKRPDTVFHGSFNRDWEKEAPRTHVGTQAAASDRLVQVAKNASVPRSGEQDAGRGRVVARRLVNAPTMVAKSDSNANSADFDLKWSASNPHHRVQYQAKEDRPIVHQAINRLERGETIGYVNSTEDQGSISHIVPRGGLRAYHEDVAEARSMGLSTYNHVADVTSPQFDPPITITPKSMMHASNSYMDRYGHAEQQTLFPYSVIHEHTSRNDAGIEDVHRTETLYETRPDDPDYDGWSRSAGHSAGLRAKAAAESSGGKLGFGVRQHHVDPPFPGDVAEVEHAHPDVLERRRSARRYQKDPVRGTLTTERGKEQDVAWKLIRHDSVEKGRCDGHQEASAVRRQAGPAIRPGQGRTGEGQAEQQGQEEVDGPQADVRTAGATPSSRSRCPTTSAAHQTHAAG